MIVKFSNHGKGKASGVLNYLIKEKGVDGRLMPRKHAKVLYGDPVGGQNSWELGGVEMEFLRII